MPTGFPRKYVQYPPAALKKPVRLEPPADAVRAYLYGEGTIRYIFSDDGGKELTKTHGMPLVEDFWEEFDTNLDQLWVIGEQQDAKLNVYYFGS